MQQIDLDSRLRLDTVPIDDLTPLHDWPGLHSPPAQQRMERFIRLYGQPTPVLIDRDQNILSGNLVWRAMRRLGASTILVIRPR